MIAEVTIWFEAKCDRVGCTATDGFEASADATKSCFADGPRTVGEARSLLSEAASSGCAFKVLEDDPEWCWWNIEGQQLLFCGKCSSGMRDFVAGLPEQDERKDDAAEDYD